MEAALRAEYCATCDEPAERAPVSRLAPREMINNLYQRLYDLEQQAPDLEFAPSELVEAAWRCRTLIRKLEKFEAARP